MANSPHQFDKSVNDFIHLTKGKIVDYRRRRKYDYVHAYPTLSSDSDYTEYKTRESDFITTCMIEVDSDQIDRIMCRIEDHNILRRKHTSTMAIVQDMNIKVSQFNTFMKKNPQLHEQYKELMAMCKLAGLDVTLDSLL